MFFLFRSNRRRVSRVRVADLVNLENRAMLAATWTSGATAITVQGTAGDDAISVGISGANFTVNGADTGVATAGRSFVTLNGLAGNDVLTLEASLGAINGNVNGGANNDTIVANNAGQNNLRGGTGTDSYVGGTGRDTLIIDEFDSGFSDQGGTSDAITATDATGGISLILGAAGFERVNGTAFNDIIDRTGETVNVTIAGFGGADTLTGGSGGDTILGGDGDDILVGGSGNDTLRGDAGNDTLDGGIGTDAIDYTTSTSGVTVDLVAGTAIDGLGGTDTITLLSVEDIKGSNFDDLLIGNSQDNYIRGQGGNDTIIGGVGADKLEGNGGTDTLSYAASDVGVVVNLLNNTASGGHAAGDKIVGFENLIGSEFADNLRGSSVVNLISGLGGDDVIDGEGGADLIDAGVGNDIVTADTSDDDSATFTGGSGTDTLKAKSDTVAVNWVLTAGASFEIIQGSNQGDTIDASAYGAGSPVTISGRGGNDLLTGGAGADTLNGDIGDDTLIGGLGEDIIRGGDGDDVLIGGVALGVNDGVRDRFFGDANTAVGDSANFFPGDTRNGVENLI